jgi:hypothetical protein
VLALPGFSPEVEARTPAPIVKTERLDIRPTGKACAQNAWPYYETACLKAPGGSQPRAIRMVTTDRFGAQ